jgi:hypothetical protein
MERAMTRRKVASADTSFTRLSRALALAAVLAGLALPARAEINEQCLVAWKLAVSAHAVGQKCQWLNPEAAKQMQAYEERQRQCAVAKATPAEAKLKAELVPGTREAVKRKLDGMPCNADARRFFDRELGQAR